MSYRHKIDFNHLESRSFGILPFASVSSKTINLKVVYDVRFTSFFLFVSEACYTKKISFWQLDSNHIQIKPRMKCNGRLLT